MQIVEQTKELTSEQISQVRAAIVDVLGNPDTDEQRKAYEAYTSGDYQGVKLLSAIYLSDNYIKTLGYLIGSFKPSPAICTLLAEASRSAGDHVKDKAIAKLGAAMKDAIG
ncbi:hypothetical protein CAL7716_065030 [Calothrix sp. PCC 7716]|nr:hypothetical protein CAL7716_065030 [Calothrix sp. PCC 7716]